MATCVGYYSDVFCRVHVSSASLVSSCVSSFFAKETNLRFSPLIMTSSKPEMTSLMTSISFSATNALPLARTSPGLRTNSVPDRHQSSCDSILISLLESGRVEQLSFCLVLASAALSCYSSRHPWLALGTLAVCNHHWCRAAVRLVQLETRSSTPPSLFHTNLGDVAMTRLLT